MSLLSAEEVLKPILLRSSTPGHNEKVWKYLEGMNRDSGIMEPPASVIGDDARSELSKSPGRKSSKAKSQSQRLDDLARSDVSYGNTPYANGQAEEDDDIKSNTQDGVRSELDIDLNGNFDHEPGPSDHPGPHYESYDSGPSFGNFGPLPTDEYSAQWQQVYTLCSIPLATHKSHPRSPVWTTCLMSNHILFLSAVTSTLLIPAVSCLSK
jgi:hypothetical protein